jgi:hypothetical protein
VANYRSGGTCRCLVGKCYRPPSPLRSGDVVAFDLKAGVVDLEGAYSYLFQAEGKVIQKDPIDWPLDERSIRRLCVVSHTRAPRRIENTQQSQLVITRILNAVNLTLG